MPALSDTSDLSTAFSTDPAGRPDIRSPDMHPAAATTDQEFPAPQERPGASLTSTKIATEVSTTHEETALQDTLTSIHSSLQSTQELFRRIQGNLERILEKLREREETNRRNHEVLMARLEGMVSRLGTAGRSRRDSGVGR